MGTVVRTRCLAVVAKVIKPMGSDRQVMWQITDLIGPEPVWSCSLILVGKAEQPIRGGTTEPIRSDP